MPEIYKTAHASHREDLTQSPLQHTQKTCSLHRVLALGTQDTICPAILNPLQSFIKTFNDFMMIAKISAAGTILRGTLILDEE